MKKNQKPSDPQPLPKKKINLIFPESQETYHRLIEAVKVGIYIADLKGNLVYVNQAFVEILGYKTRDDIIGKNLAKELYADPSERELFLKKMSETGFVREYEVRNVKKAGDITVLLATSNYIYDDKENVIGVEGVVHDVSEKKKLEEALIWEKSKLEQILGFDEKISSIRKFDSLIDFIVEKTTGILEADKCSIMLVDEETQDLCIQGSKGLSEEIVKKTRIKLGEPITGIVAKEREALLVKNIECDQRFRRASLSHYATRSFMSVPFQIGDKLLGVINVADKRSKLNQKEEAFNEIDLRILSVIAREVAVSIENVKLYKELNFLTVTDPLTHLFNYRYFTRTLNYEIKRMGRVPGQLTVLMIDLDDFKSYNDALGHLAGDQLLKEFGRLFKESVRETDIVCRYAGDEFAIVLPHTNVEGGRIVAEKIKNKAGNHVFQKPVTLSVGVAVLHPGMDDRDLVQKADRALYQAKHEGKNKVCVLM